MKAIVVAAGRGSRLEPYTKDRPKCALEFAGRRLLDWQEAALAHVGVERAELVLGYHPEQLDDGTRQVWINDRWNETNMVSSLLCARPTLASGEPVVVVYGDIVFQPDVIKALVAAEGDIRVIVDRKWLRYWQMRNEDPLFDAESLRIEADGRLLDIGQKVKAVSEIQAQYIGLLYFSPAGCQALLDFMDRAEEGAPWLLGRSVDKCYMTDVLRGMIQSGHRLQGVGVDNGWLEFDTVSDYQTYCRMLEEGTLGEYFDTHWAV